MQAMKNKVPMFILCYIVLHSKQKTDELFLTENIKDWGESKDS